MTGQGTLADGRHLRRANSRERIYDAAMSLLEERDFDSLTVDEICAAAGAGRATFFRIYGGKSGLVLEFNRRLAARAKNRLERLKGADTRTRLLAIGEEVAGAWSTVNPAARSIAAEFMRTLTIVDIHQGHPDLLKLLKTVIGEGIEAGELKAAFPPGFLGSLAIMQIGSSVMLWFDHPDSDLAGLIAAAIDQWLTGVERS